MEKRLSHILKRLDSCHLAKLWSFYRNYFVDDDACLSFIYEAVANEPEVDNTIYRELDKASGSFINDAGVVIYDSSFIPRRMLNAVEHLVTTAWDMEHIRRGKDIFKIVFLITCIETLQKLGGKTGSKKDLVFGFFENYTNEENKKFIAEHFSHYDEEYTGKPEDSFKQFVGMLNEYRNCATHEGEYWDFCFDNNQENGSILLALDIDLEKFSPYNKKEHCFRTSVSYKQFEKIFVEACIEFIKDYTSGTDSK